MSKEDMTNGNKVPFHQEELRTLALAQRLPVLYYCPGCERRGIPSCYTEDFSFRVPLMDALKTKWNLPVVFCIRHTSEMPRSPEDTVARTGLCECGHGAIPYHTTKRGHCFACPLIGKVCLEFKAGISPV